MLFRFAWQQDRRRRHHARLCTGRHRVLLDRREPVSALAGLGAVAAVGCHESRGPSPQFSGLLPSGAVAGGAGSHHPGLCGGILSDPGLGDRGDGVPLRPVCPVRDFLFFRTSKGREN